jgi:hypothetical protein
MGIDEGLPTYSHLDWMKQPWNWLSTMKGSAVKERESED